MPRNLADPLDAGVFHGHVGVEPLGDGLEDDGPSVLAEQLHLAFAVRNECVDLGGLGVEIVGNLSLFIQARQNY